MVTNNEPITDIEKMVWASTFALALKAYMESIPTHDSIWQDRCEMFAIKKAYDTVISLRKTLARFQAAGDPEDTSEPHELAKFFASLGFSTNDSST